MKARTAGSIFNSISLLSFFLVSIEKHFSYQWNLKQKKWNSSVVKGLSLSEIHHLVGWIVKRYFKVCGAGLLFLLTRWRFLLPLPELHLSSQDLCVRNCFKKNQKHPTSEGPKQNYESQRGATWIFHLLLPLTCFQWTGYWRYLGQSRSYAGLLTFMYTKPIDLTVHFEANDTH